jgi:hypothetical protein
MIDIEHMFSVIEHTQKQNKSAIKAEHTPFYCFKIFAVEEASTTIFKKKR